MVRDSADAIPAGDTFAGLGGLIAVADAAGQDLTGLNAHVTTIDLSGKTGVVVSADQSALVTDTVTGGSYAISDQATKIIEFYGNPSKLALLTGASSLDVEDASLEQAIDHFADKTSGLGLLVDSAGSYSLSQDALSATRGAALTVAQAKAATGSDYFNDNSNLH